MALEQARALGIGDLDRRRIVLIFMRRPANGNAAITFAHAADLVRAAALSSGVGYSATQCMSAKSTRSVSRKFTSLSISSVRKPGGRDDDGLVDARDLLKQRPVVG